MAPSPSKPSPLLPSLSTLLSLPQPSIPPLLVSTTATLLALSHRRLPTLKPDEEIARPHACAEIACKRLRVELRLPAIRSGEGAPCRPGIYTKLLGLLEGVLGEDAQTPSRRNVGSVTPGGRKRVRDVQQDEDGEWEEGEGEGLETPTKRRRTTVLANARTATPQSARKAQAPASQRFLAAVARTPTKSAAMVRAEAQEREDRAPAYVMPLVRGLCRTFTTPKLAPHVFTGLCVILGAWREKKEVDGEMDEGEEKREVVALVIATYLMVLTRMQKGKITTKVYTKTCERSLEVCRKELAEEGGESKRAVEEWIERINREGWAAGQDWWASVPEGVILGPKLDQSVARGVDGEGVEVDDSDEERSQGAASVRRWAVKGRAVEGSRKDELRKELAEIDSDGVLLPGLGTMMNYEVDYLSELRMERFQRLEKELKAMIAKAKKGGPPASAKKAKAVVRAAA